MGLHQRCTPRFWRGRSLPAVWHPDDGCLPAGMLLRHPLHIVKEKATSSVRIRGMAPTMKNAPSWGVCSPGGEAGIQILAARESRAPAKASAPFSYGTSAGRSASRKTTSSVRIRGMAPTMKNAPGWGACFPGGEAGIRTLVTGVTGKTVFETAAFNRSATSPKVAKSGGETGI